MDNVNNEKASTKINSVTITFIVDAMLGELARWLRLMGYDTVYCANQLDNDILENVSNRILLTRDKELLIRAYNQGLVGINPGKGPISVMLNRLKRKLYLDFSIDPNKSRCPQCNSRLASKSPKEVHFDTITSFGNVQIHNVKRCIGKAVIGQE